MLSKTAVTRQVLNIFFRFLFFWKLQEISIFQILEKINSKISYFFMKNSGPCKLDPYFSFISTIFTLKNKKTHSTVTGTGFFKILDFPEKSNFEDELAHLLIGLDF